MLFLINEHTNYICMLLVLTHINEWVLFPFFHQKILWSNIKLAYVWSAGGHSWTSCFTIPESISQRYYRRSERLSDISHSVLSAEGMMSGMANKVCVKSLNKAWNWQDACLSKAPQSHRPLLQQTGTAAHLQTARLLFGLPLKCPALRVNTFNAENDFIHFPL